MSGQANSWKAIPGFDGAYEINAAGDVRSWKVWRGDSKALPRAMRVQTSRRTGKRTIQLGLHGGTHDVDDLVAQLFGESPVTKSSSQDATEEEI